MIRYKRQTPILKQVLLVGDDFTVDNSAECGESAMKVSLCEMFGYPADVQVSVLYLRAGGPGHAHFQYLQVGLVQI